MSDRTNADWLAKLAAHDEETVAELRERLVRGLQRVLAGRADPSAAEDFAQDAVLKVLDSLHSFRGDSQFVTWALAVATRVAFTELRKARYRDVSLSTVPVAEPVAAPAVAKDIDEPPLLVLLRRLVQTVLTDKQRALIEGELSGVPQAVLIERFGTTRNAFYKLGHDARMKLKRALESEGVTPEEVSAAFVDASNH